MPKRLSIFCSCLPRKQCDNLSSRALYHDQDSSSGLDDYSGDEDDPFHHHHGHYRNSPARLEALGPSSLLLARDPSGSTPHNLWPSNGRFSRQANHHPSQRQSTSSSLGSRGSHRQRKPNPFRAEEPYRDDTSSDDDDDDENGGSSRIARASSASRTKKSTFTPYRDDDESDEDAEALREQHLHTSSLAGRGEGPSTPVQGAPRLYPKMEYTPYRVEAGFWTGQAHPPPPPARRMRQPRNPQGSSMAWQESADEDKRGRSSAEADAEEVIDVDALIAEQERITRELAAQEEALRKDEEDLIQKKKLAAIHAAEKRGLLRFEGGQLVIPTSGHPNNTSNLIISHKAPHSSLSEQEPMERTTSSAASSYVGGIDAFDQEFKLMSLEVKNHRKEIATGSLRSPASTSTSTPSLTPTTRLERPPVAVRTVSTGVSTSTSSFVASPTLNINPRGVLNNISSFLRKVDGVIAGESSDEASFSDQEQHLDKKNSNNNTNNSHDHQRTGGPGTVNKGPQGMASPSRQTTGRYSTSTAEGDKLTVRTVAINVDPMEPQEPQEDPSHSNDTIIYPTDVFNGPSESLSGRASPAGSTLSTLGSRASSMKRPMDDSEPRGIQTTAPPSLSPSQPLSPSVTAAASERIFDTFTSFFNSGSSFMGLFGTGHCPEEDDHSEARMRSDDEKHGRRRLSSLKYGDPKTHRFDYREHGLEDDGPPAGGSLGGRRGTPAAKKSASAAADDDDDDGDSSSMDDYDF